MIKLIHDYVIDINQSNYILMLDRHKKDKKGNDVYDVLAYCSDFQRAIQKAKEACAKKKLSDGVYSLDEAVEIIRKINDEFTELLTRRMEGDEGE